MNIVYHKHFSKRFHKLPESVKNKICLAIDKFLKNPHDISLKNHKLKGDLNNHKAISASSDIRLIFKEYDNYTLVIFVNLGTHNQVYK